MDVGVSLRGGGRSDRRYLVFGCLGLFLAFAAGIGFWVIGVTRLPPPTGTTRVLPPDNGHDAVQAAIISLPPLKADSPVALRTKASLAELRAALEPDLATLLELRTALRKPYMTPEPTPAEAAAGTASVSMAAQNRSTALHLAAMATLREREGKPVEAWEWSLDGMELGAKLGRGGTMLTALSGTSMVSNAARTALSKTDLLTDGEARAVRERLGRIIAAAPTVADVLNSEREAALLGIRHQPHWGAMRAIVYREVAAFYREAMTDAQAPRAERQPPAPPTGQYARVLGPTVASLRKSLEERDRTLAVLHARLAVREYWAKHGRLPKSWQDLVPAILPGPPLDPVKQRPFRYRRLSDDLYEVSPPP